MSHSVRLPNGFLMTNVPDAATQSEVAKHAVEKGYATPEDFGAFPDVYQAVGGDPKNMPSKWESALGATPEIMKGVREYADSPLVRAQGEIRNLAAGLAVMPEAGATKGALTAAELLTNIGTSNADQLTHNLQDGTQGGYGRATLEGAAAVPAGMAIGKVGGKLIKPLWDKISPATAQYLKGFFKGADRAADVSGKTGFRDEIPHDFDMPANMREPTPGTRQPIDESQIPDPWRDSRPPERTEPPVSESGGEGVGKDWEGGERATAGDRAAKKAAEKASTDRLRAIEAQQNEWLDEFHRVAAHRMSSLEAESYLQAALSKTETASNGETVENALNFYRRFVDDYETAILPHPGAANPELSGLSQFEAIMREDSPAIHKLISDHESGVEVHPQQLYDAIEAYKIGTVQAVKDWFKTKPDAFIDDLITAEKAAPGVTEWLDAQGALGEGRRRFVESKLHKAHVAGTMDAISGITDKFLKDIVEERAITSQEFLYATQNGIRNMATALKHKLGTLDKMENNVRAAISQAKGEKLPTGAKGWQDVTPDENAIYWGMVNTHEGAQRGADVMRQYRRFESLKGALPGIRDIAATDRAIHNTLTAAAGFGVGGLPGAIVAPILKSKFENVANVVRRKLVKSELTRAIEQEAKK